jgi:hypothetical protein
MSGGAMDPVLIPESESFDGVVVTIKRSGR